MIREKYLLYYEILIKEVIKMAKIDINKVMVVKVLGMAMTIGGMLASSWTGKKEQDQTIAKLVDEKINCSR